MLMKLLSPVTLLIIFFPFFRNWIISIAQENFPKGAIKYKCRVNIGNQYAITNNYYQPVKSRNWLNGANWNIGSEGNSYRSYRRGISGIVFRHAFVALNFPAIPTGRAKREISSNDLVKCFANIARNDKF